MTDLRSTDSTHHGNDSPPMISEVLKRALDRSVHTVQKTLGASGAFLLLGDPAACRHRISAGITKSQLAHLEQRCYEAGRNEAFVEFIDRDEGAPDETRRLRSLSGVPLRPPGGLYIGVLFVGYADPRSLNDSQKELLRHFADMVFDQIDLHRSVPAGVSAASASHLETAIEKCPTAVVVTDSGGRITTWNRAMEAITGYSAREVLGAPSPLSYPEPEKLQHMVEHILNRGAVERYVLPIRDKSGRYAVHGVSATSFADKEGRFAGTIAVSSDITEHQELQEQLKLFRAALVHSEDGVALLDIPPDSEPQPVISFVNQAFCRITGYTEEELLGNSPLMLTGKENQKEEFKRIASAIKNCAPLRMEAKTKRKDGSYVWTDLNFTPLCHDAHDRIQYAVFQHDITERRELHEALATSEARFRSLVQNIEEVFTLADENGIIQYQSPSVTPITGYDPEELVGESMFDYIHPEDLPYFSGVVERLLKEKTDASLVGVRVRCRGGNWIWAEGLLSDLRDDPHVRCIVVNWRDVSEFRRLQQQVFMSDRLASLGTLAAGVAHEINNPLTYILGNIEYTLYEIDRLSPNSLGPRVRADLQEALEEARGGANRVRNIVRDLNAFSRPESDTQAQLDVNEVVRKTLNLARNEIRHQATIRENYAEVPKVLANESRLGQVFMNLLVNASQALGDQEGDQNHEIGIQTSVNPEGNVEVRISDTGVGIPEHLRERIFDPFFSTKPVGQGTGLGLSICHGLIAAMGGDLRVESQEGQGSTFIVSLPPTEGSTPEVEAYTDTAPPPQSRKRVLLIDDEPKIQSTVERLLEDDCDVTVAYDGAEALEQLAEASYDVILCDLLMPIMTGMELYEHLRRTDPETAGRFVFITGGAFTPAAREFMDTVDAPRLMKPFTQRALKRAIHAVSPDQPDT